MVSENIPPTLLPRITVSHMQAALNETKLALMPGAETFSDAAMNEVVLRFKAMQPEATYCLNELLKTYPRGIRTAFKAGFTLAYFCFQQALKQRKEEGRRCLKSV